MNTHVAKIKGLDDSKAEKLIGALIMSMQAVRNLIVPLCPVLRWSRLRSDALLNSGKRVQKPKKDDEIPAFSKVIYSDNFEHNEEVRPSMTRIGRGSDYVYRSMPCITLGATEAFAHGPS